MDFDRACNLAKVQHENIQYVKQEGNFNDPFVEKMVMENMERLDGIYIVSLTIEKPEIYRGQMICLRVHT